MYTVTKTEALAELERVVAAAGGDTTRECQYLEYTDEYLVHGEDYESDAIIGPHCIAGSVLWNIAAQQGTDALEKMKRQLWVMEETTMGSGTYNEHETGIKFDADAMNVLDAAQSTQDANWPWQDALENARTV